MDPKDAIFEYAKRGVDEDLEELLASNKVNPGAVDALGNTPLHYAASADHTKACVLLLNKGAPINFGNKLKETPLHKAAARGALRSCKLLVNRGADLTRVDGNGKTPREVAKSGVADLYDLLTPAVSLDQGEEGGEYDADEYDEAAEEEEGYEEEEGEEEEGYE